MSDVCETANCLQINDCKLVIIIYNHIFCIIKVLPVLIRSDLLVNTILPNAHSILLKRNGFFNIQHYLYSCCVDCNILDKRFTVMYG